MKAVMVAVALAALAGCARPVKHEPVQDLYCKLDRLMTPPTEIVQAVQDAMNRGEIKREVADKWVTAVLDHDDTYIAKCPGFERK